MINEIYKFIGSVEGYPMKRNGLTAVVVKSKLKNKFRYGVQFWNDFEIENKTYNEFTFIMTLEEYAKQI